MKKISNIAKIMKTAISGAKKSVIFIDIVEFDVTCYIEFRLFITMYHLAKIR
ncbi:MAG: hypothetical protein LN569_03565 [Rickettsia endosymbiont of Labidopullus appendiculatus]|nr:hypothetical protein [Rickettsia endosymbiont of Labidopullus appendiculatus]